MVTPNAMDAGRCSFSWEAYTQLTFRSVFQKEEERMAIEDSTCICHIRALSSMTA
jgi:hypothetical protein